MLLILLINWAFVLYKFTSTTPLSANIYYNTYKVKPETKLPNHIIFKSLKKFVYKKLSITDTPKYTAKMKLSGNDSTDNSAPNLTTLLNYSTLSLHYVPQGFLYQDRKIDAIAI